MTREWNPALYESKHSFVWEYGRDLLALLSPQPGERILDVGCGTGQLTAEIAAAGAQVLGIDRSAAMIAQAAENFPGLCFELHDVCALPFRAEFDAVFSNAMLHWVLRAEEAAAAIAAALKPGGRFVAELGGSGNVRVILEAVRRALESEGSAPESLNPWFFPTVGEYASILERCELEVSFAALFDRPTALEGGPRGFADWLSMFGAPVTPRLQDPAFVERVEQFASPHLFHDGAWTADYRRLRIVARRAITSPRSARLPSDPPRRSHL